MRAEKSSERDKKIFVRKVCRRVRQDSPGSADLRELMLCVAMMGIHLGCLDKLKNFSSPVGSLSPTVAKCWYSSQRNNTCRKYPSGFFSMRGTRLSTARSKSSFNITPRALARPAFMAIGKLRLHKLPFSMSHASEGNGLPNLKSALACGS